MSRALQGYEGSAATTQLYALLGESYRKHGHLEEGFTTVAMALREAERSGERTAETELYRVKGVLLLMRDPTDEAEVERCFRTAIDLARDQKARFYELRERPALPACSNGRANATRRARCFPKSTAGSPKASNSATSKTPGHCSRNSELAEGEG